jgi:transposase InsO family protein
LWLCVTSQEGLWWLAKLLQPLTLGTTHVQVRWLEGDFVMQKKLHDTSRVYVVYLVVGVCAGVVLLNDMHDKLLQSL